MLASSEELLRTALEGAFPDRGPALFREVRRWFDDSRASRLPAAERPKDDGSRPCALCNRPSSAMSAVVRMIPATKRMKAQFKIPGADTPLEAPRGALHACSACLYGWMERFGELGRDPAGWPHPDMVLTDVRRALDAQGTSEAAALMKEIDERTERTGPRRAGTVTCDVCARRRVSLSGPRGRVCLECVEAAHRPLYNLLASLSRLGRR
jgi:hypothetical protein